MNPYEFIKLSDKLVPLGPAGARSSISRCYYGAFHEALDFLDSVACGCPRNGNAHNLAPIFLDFSANLDAKRASRLLGDLHAERLKSDYRLGDAATEHPDYARTAVATSRKVCDLLKAFRAACQSADVLQAFQGHVAKIKQIRRLP